jgi:hypothetical protein
MAVRQARKHVLDQTRTGQLTISQVLERGKNDPVVAKVKVRALVEAFPGYGSVRATRGACPGLDRREPPGG